jgi:quinol monooxygenase YgiN
MITFLVPTLGFIQQPNQTIPSDVVYTIVKYKTSGDREKVVDLCFELFRFMEEIEFYVYSLAIMNDVDRGDEFVVLERYLDKEAEEKHLGGEMCQACLKEDDCGA